MTKPTTHTTPTKARATTTRPGHIARWLADLGLGYVLMLTASIGGLIWLVAIHLFGIRHDAALILSLAAVAGAFARAHQLASRAVAARQETDPEVPQ
ncbi:hypothetical protein OG417_21315 [Actinoallomurus sp. NBC_01490]|uniref:hypothetical protein n=1 Tax=Actinoallomurus sp. NBC_01490 TaxID=2903557 RepID=UPI002E3480D2|nr:hypothetical protein [Actinoallomurus sp. NBC_01490]